MKPIDKDELYEHVSGFLKGKGVELKAGSYANGIQKGCTLLAEAINLSQKGLSRAKVEVDKKLDTVRQVIHEKTAPKTKAAAQTAKPAGPKAKPQSSKGKAKPVKRASVKR
jgi:hypothetical protein